MVILENGEVASLFRQTVMQRSSASASSCTPTGIWRACSGRDYGVFLQSPIVENSKT